MKYPKILHQISLFIFLFSLCKCLCVEAVEFKVTQRQTNYKVNGQSKRFQRVKGLHFLLAPRAPALPLTENEHFVISFFFSIFTSLLNQLIILCISIFYVYIYIFYISNIYNFFGTIKTWVFYVVPTSPLPLYLMAIWGKILNDECHMNCKLKRKKKKKPFEINSLYFA